MVPIAEAAVGRARPRPSRPPVRSARTPSFGLHSPSLAPNRHSGQLETSSHPLFGRMSSSAPPRLDTLPPELILRILDHASPRTIARLGQVNKALSQLARTESVWKAVVQNITREHSAGNVVDDRAVLGELWLEQAKFVVPIARQLGYWTSSQPYR